MIVQWFKDGQVISSGIISLLELPCDSETYVCIVCAVKLTIENCVDSERPPVNSDYLFVGSRINYVNDFGCVTLDISNLRPSDEGIYECKAKNALGEATSTASIKVSAKGSLLLDSQHPEGMRKITALEMGKTRSRPQDEARPFDKPAFLTPLTGVSELSVGQHAHMECRVIPVGDPAMKFEWYCNGEQLQMGSRFMVTQDFGFVTLDIASCVESDSGMYMVKAINAAGEAASSHVLKVGDQRGGVLGEALHPDSYKKIQALEARKAAAGPVEDTAIIEQPPVFMKQLPDIGAVPEGTNVHVDATIEPKNDPSLKVEWELNGKPISSGKHAHGSVGYQYARIEVAVPRDLNGMTTLH